MACPSWERRWTVDCLQVGRASRGLGSNRFSQDRHDGQRKAVLNRKNFFCCPEFSRPSSFHLPFCIFSKEWESSSAEPSYCVKRRSPSQAISLIWKALSAAAVILTVFKSEQCHPLLKALLAAPYFPAND